MVDPKARGREFYLEMAKAIWKEWEDMRVSSFSKG